MKDHFKYFIYLTCFALGLALGLWWMAWSPSQRIYQKCIYEYIFYPQDFKVERTLDSSGQVIAIEIIKISR